MQAFIRFLDKATMTGGRMGAWGAVRQYISVVPDGWVVDGGC